MSSPSLSWLFLPIPVILQCLVSRCSQSRPRAGATKCGTDLGSSVSALLALAGASRQQLTAHLPHTLLLLHGQDVLLLSPGKGKGDTDKQGAHGDRPSGTAEESKGGAHDTVAELEFAVEPATCGWRDDVAQGIEPLAKRLAAGVVVRVCGNLRVCLRSRLHVSTHHLDTFNLVILCLFLCVLRTGIGEVLLLLSTHRALLEVLVLDLD